MFDTFVHIGTWSNFKFQRNISCDTRIWFEEVFNQSRDARFINNTRLNWHLWSIGLSLVRVVESKYNVSTGRRNFYLVLLRITIIYISIKFKLQLITTKISVQATRYYNNSMSKVVPSNHLCYMVFFVSLKPNWYSRNIHIVWCRDVGLVNNNNSAQRSEHSAEYAARTRVPSPWLSVAWRGVAWPWPWRENSTMELRPIDFPYITLLK